MTDIGLPPQHSTSHSPCTLCGQWHRYQHPDGSDGNPSHEASTVACIQHLKPLLPPRCIWCGWYRHGDPGDPVTMRRCAVHMRTDLADHDEDKETL